MKINFWFLGVLFMSLIALNSCLSPEEEFSNNPNINLEFSNRIVVLDTLINQVRQPSTRLQVYNPSNNAIRIDQIALGQKENSPFSLIVNGQKGFDFSEIEILGKDSLLIVIETNFSNTLTNLEEKFDSIVFSRNGNLQDVKILAWAEPVEVLQSVNIDQNISLESGKSYLVQDSLIVNATLIIPDSVNIYFFNDAYLKINGSLNIQGVAEKPVRFSFYRKDTEFENSTGTWQGVLVEKNAQIQAKFLDIKNASTAFEITEGNLSLKNTIIHYLSDYGVRADNAQVYLENTLIYNCADNLVFSENGGNFEFIHNTLAYFDFSLRTTSTALYFENEINNPLSITCKNTIIWGEEEEMIFISSLSEPSFDFGKNIIQTTLDFILQTDNLKEAPKFESEAAANFNLLSSSPAIDKGENLGISIDLRGRNREATPDIGAYEFMNE